MKVHFSSKTNEWATPQDFFDKMDQEFGFTLDVASTDENTKVSGRYFTEKDDGLNQSWDREIVWCNPPYGRTLKNWVKKASEATGGVIVMLIPARTDTSYFHDYIYQKPNVEIRFIRGRLKFGGSKNSAPFPSMIVVFTPPYKTVSRVTPTQHG